jgi:DUF1016 N-terminal domain
MKKDSKQTALSKKGSTISGYDAVLSDIVDLLESARRASARTINAIITVTCWEIGPRIIESEQSGKKRAEYGEQLLKHLSKDLSHRFGRGFGNSLSCVSRLLRSTI